MSANTPRGPGTTPSDAMVEAPITRNEPASSARAHEGAEHLAESPVERSAVAPDASTVDASVPGTPVQGLDMRLQWNAVHERLFGRPAEEHRIGRYLVRGTLGQGAMGRVLRVRDETLGRDVALKVLHDAGTAQHEQRLLREAQALARLSHPNVVRVYDVAKLDGRVCMAMELVEGTPLLDWQREPRPWPQVLEIYLQAARGLAAAHAAGLVHRDFKPANCIVDAQGTLKVLDFGLARGVAGTTGPHAAVELEHTDDGERSDSGSGGGERPVALRSQQPVEPALTRTGAVLGTLAYMAPEQLMGRPAEPRSDQFAFCVSFHEGLYGARPFPGKNALGILHSIQSRRVDVPAARAGLPPVPRWLHEVLRRGLSVAIHERWPDMKALASALERGRTRRRRIRGAALGVVLLGSLGGALAASGVLEGERPCAGLRDRAMPAWTEDDRLAVGEALAAASPEGARAGELVEARLDAYAQAWTEARADACEDTWVRHEVHEQGLVRRMGCLDERAEHVRAVVEQLASADARAAAFAGEAVERLPELAPCSDVDALLRGPEPVPEALADEAAEVRALVARSWALGALGATGDDAHGMEAADRAVAESEALVDAPTLRLEALHNRGHLFRMARRWAEARRDLEDALALAERLEDSARSIDVLVELVLLANDERDVSAARAWLGGLRGRLDEQPRRVAQRWWLEGIVATLSDRNHDALTAAERAVQEYEQLEPPVHGEWIEALLLLGGAHRRLGDFERARAALEQALSLAESAGRLPLVAEALYRLGHLHHVQDELEEAQSLLERALVLRSQFYGPGAVASIRTQALLAQTLFHRGELPLAIEHVSRARRSLDERVPAQIRGEVLELAGALHRADERWDDAIASYREARIAWHGSLDPAQLAMIDSNIAECLAAQGKPEQARALYDDVLARLDVVAPDDPRTIHPLLGRGQLLSQQGERDAAVVDLRAALELHGTHSSDAFLGAEVRWALGRALRPIRGGEEGVTREATALACTAREVFAELGGDARVQEIDAWLEQWRTSCSSTE